MDHRTEGQDRERREQPRAKQDDRATLLGPFQEIRRGMGPSKERTLNTAEFPPQPGGAGRGHPLPPQTTDDAFRGSPGWLRLDTGKIESRFFYLPRGVLRVIEGPHGCKNH